MRALGISTKQINDYIKKFNWNKRAKDRRERSVALAEEEAVHKIADMLNKHYDVAEQLLDRAQEFIETNEIDSYKDAVAAVKLGVDIQRQVKELPAWVVGVKHAPTDQLKAELRRLREAPGRVISSGDNSGTEGEGRALGPGSGDDIIDVGYQESDAGQGLLEVPNGSDRICEERAKLLSVE